MAHPLGLLALAVSMTLGGLKSADSADYRVTAQTIPILKSVFGQVRSRDQVPARARIGGTLVDISVQEGDQVRAGQVIARVVDEKLVLQLGALEASEQAVSAQLENATTNLDRASQLFARGTIARSRLDELQTQVDVLTNNLRAIDAKKAVIVQQGNEGEVAAPSAGRVLAVPVTQGSVVLPGETVVRIAGGGYFLRLSLPERHAAGIQKGDIVVVGKRGINPVDSAAGSKAGRIVKVYPEIKNGRVIADVDVEGLGDFFVGERFLVSIPIGSRDSIGVPESALTTRHGIDYVRLRHGDGTTEVSVIPGEPVHTNLGTLIEILSGLKIGDKVVLP